MPHNPNPLDEIRQYEAVLQQALDEWDGMSHEERLAELKDAGILDEEGRLAARYRDEDEEGFDRTEPARSVG